MLMWFVCCIFLPAKGCSHTVCWMKSFISMLKQVFQSFSVTIGKKGRKIQKQTKNHALKGLPEFAGFSCNFFAFFYIFSFFLSVSDEKRQINCFVLEKMILISARHAEHPFTGQNTQNLFHIVEYFVKRRSFVKSKLYKFKLQFEMKICQPDLESSATRGTAARKTTPLSPAAI